MTRFARILHWENKIIFYSYKNNNFSKNFTTTSIRENLDNLQCYVPENLDHYAPSSPQFNTLDKSKHNVLNKPQYIAPANHQSNVQRKSISDFYDGKSVFVTGGTGFLGKVLVEKLLYETNIEKMFVLIREKNGESIDKRVSEMLNNPIFDRLKEAKPLALNKIVPITGDIIVPDLGIKKQDAKILSEQVSIVFNVAASVIFEEPVKTSLNFNYESTKRLLNLAHQMKKIESFVHVSSTYAYAFDGESTIKESLYPPPENHERIEALAENHNDDDMEIKKFVGKRANIYTYCKAMAETYVAENHGTIPTCIVRPSSITAKIDPPLPGWLDNWFGPTRYYYTIAKGWNRLCYSRKDYWFDMIPVDYCANLCIIAAAKNNGCGNVPVYNSCSTGVNPLAFKSVRDCFISDAVKYKINDIPYPFVIFTSSKFLLSIYTLLLQSIPIRIADGWLWITGRNPKYTKAEKKFEKLRSTLHFFTNNSWLIECDNARRLFGTLSASDQKRFPCDPINIDWKKYLRDYLLGIERFLIKKNRSNS